MKINLHIETGQESQQVLNTIRKILESNYLCSISSVCEDGTPYINTAFFGFDEKLSLYFISNMKTTHALNVIRTGRAAVTVFDSTQTMGAPLRGVQLFGDCKLAAGRLPLEAMLHYFKRFHDYKVYWDGLTDEEKKLNEFKFFVFRSKKVKILAEDEYGEENYLVANIIMK